MPTVGIVSPGEMGSAVGAALRRGGARVVATLEGRSVRTAAKSARYVGEMHEIAAAQAAAGLPPELFEAMAAVWAEIARTPLAQSAPEEAGADLGDALRGLG